MMRCSSRKKRSISRNASLLAAFTHVKEFMTRLTKLRV